jgi:hypothetical protein
MRIQAVVTVVATMVAVSPADARQVSAPPAASAASSAPPPKSPAPDLEGHTWTNYHAAFRLLISGRSGGARDLLLSIRAWRPSHPAASWAGRVLSALEGKPAAPAAAAEDEVWLSYHAAFELVARQQDDDAVTRLRAIAERQDGHPASARAAAVLEAASKGEADRQEDLLPITYEPGYRLPMVALDVGFIALIAAGVWVPLPGQLVNVGLLGYALGGPVLHAVHGNVGRALGSLGVRLAAPVLVALAAWGLVFSDSRSDLASFAAGILGITVGSVVGSVVDVLVLATPKAVKQKPRVTGVTLMPQLALVGGSTMVAMRARF